MISETKIETTVAVIGLGYVGLPVAVNFQDCGFPIIGFENDPRRIEDLRAGRDHTSQIPPERLQTFAPAITNDEERLRTCDVFIIIVQTGLDASLNPDFSAVENATRNVAKSMKRGSLVILSSTVTIGFTEERFIPLLERESSWTEGVDFHVAFAPERMDPGNREHTLRNIAKVIAARNQETADRTERLYAQVLTGQIVRAPSIKVAEASRLIENGQRDANIAFLNDAAVILSRAGVDIGEVLAISRTKWNFLPFHPGMVGGHCVNVHTHYLRQAASHAGLVPALTALIRRTNDEVPARVAHACARLLMQQQVSLPAVVTVLGATYKENVPDVRGSAAISLAKELMSYGCKVQLADPYAAPEDVRKLHNLDLVPESELEAADAVIVAVDHRPYSEGGWPMISGFLKPKGVVLDLPGKLPPDGKPEDTLVWRL